MLRRIIDQLQLIVAENELFLSQDLGIYNH